MASSVEDVATSAQPIEIGDAHRVPARGEERASLVMRWAAPVISPRVAVAVASVLGVVGLWSLVTVLHLFTPSLLPGPWRVASAGWSMYRDGTLLPDVAASMRRAALGLALGASLAITVGLGTARSALVRAAIEPTLRLLSPIPTIALVPLAVLWFGLGEQAKMLLIAGGTFFPVWINAHQAFAATPREYLRVCATLGARRRDILTRVMIPQALPPILGGLRAGIATSFILIVAAELSGTTVGLGYRLEQAELFSQADRLLFCLLLLGLLGALADRLLSIVVRPWIRWASE